jgi:type 2 lantibiotic biosynthesis protein LanM
VKQVASRAVPAGGAEPGWERELARWLEAAARMDDAHTGAWNASLAEAALGPLLAAADTALARQLARVKKVEVLPSARRALTGLLSRRLTAACVQVLAHERQALEALSGAPGVAPPLDASVTGWLERFEAYPVLAWVMTRLLLDWRAYSGELVSRLARDSALLGTSLFQGHGPRMLAGVQGDLGDLHDGGRSVAVLRFETGHHVVYKPKDLRITRGVQELCAFLNARGLPLPLHVREVLCRDGYAWEEFVPAAPCHTAAEVERFYLRMGMLVRLLQVLEGRDLWLDNLVAAGEHPVFVDLEMVLQPRRRGLADTPASRLAEEQLQDSVALLGILAAPVALEAGLLAEDVGALTPPRAFMSPLRHVPSLDALTGGGRARREGHVLWTREAYAPTLAGEPARAVEHLEALLEGYRAMHARLRASGPELLAADGPLARLSGLPVRYIHRDTWTCYRLTQAGLAPSLLTHPERREAAFARLLHAASPEAEAEQPAVREEVEALRRLDVPYFLCHTEGRALLGADGRLLREGFFEGDALSRARQRLREVEAFPLARHEDLLRSTLATGRHTPRAPAPPRAVEAVAPDWLAEAVALGDVLLGEAFSADNALAWLGVTYQPLHGLRQVDVLPPDVLTGSAGIALVLADLHRVSGLERFRAAALGALEATRLATARAVEAPSAATGSRALIEVGAFRGLGAQLHALHRCAHLLDAPALGELARARVASLPLEELVARSPLDVVSGLAGLLLVLLASDEAPAARRLVELLEQRLATGAIPPPMPEARRLEGLPPLSEGLALCAARVEKGLGLVPRWKSPAPEGNGSIGALLARLAVAGETGRANAPLRAEVLHTLEGASAAASGATRLDALELALVAAQVWQEDVPTAHARRLGATLLTGRRLQGRWFPELLEADAQNLSALWGLSAVAHALLRLHAPQVPSLRLIASAREVPR